MIASTSTPPSYQLVVAIQRSDGRLLETPTPQPLEGFKRSPSGLLLLPTVGRDLLYLLQQQLDLVEVTASGARISSIGKLQTQADLDRSAAIILGHVAEAMVVVRCRESPELNRRYARIARLGTNVTKSVDGYVAVGTGLKSTRSDSRFAGYYSPFDTNRDVMWIRPESGDELQMIQRRRTSGLQVKCGRDSKSVIKSIRSGNYLVPVLYFDLDDGFDRVAEATHADRIEGDGPGMLVRGREVDPDGHEKLLQYDSLLRYWLRNDGTIDGLLSEADALQDPVLRGGAMLASVGGSAG